MKNNCILCEKEAYENGGLTDLETKVRNCHINLMNEGVIHLVVKVPATPPEVECGHREQDRTEYLAEVFGWKKRGEIK